MPDDDDEDEILEDDGGEQSPPEEEEQEESSASTSTSTSTPTSPYHNHYSRLLLGSLALFAVDLIWVLSSELSSQIYHEESFDKPFFTTFVKTSMFLLFLFFKSGRVLSRDNNISNHEEGSGYTLIPNSEADTTVTSSTSSLSPPAFIPAPYFSNNNAVDNSSATSAAATSSEGEGQSDDKKRKKKKKKTRVKFSRLTEIRHMSHDQAREANLARRSYFYTSRQRQSGQQRTFLTVAETARVGLGFCCLWFLANYAYALALSNSKKVALVNVLSATSSLFTLFLSGLFPSTPGDKITLSKLICVLISICGVGVVSFSNSGDGKVVDYTVYGVVWSLFSALFYAAYLVFLKRGVGDSNTDFDVLLFFGFVGLFNLLLLWPLFFILHFTHFEPFSLPNNRQWSYLIVNGLIGTVGSEVLWVWGTLLTSPLIATLAITLTIPMTMLADVMVLKRVSYSWMFYVGAVPVVLAFVGVTAFSYWGNESSGDGGWDPVGECCRGVFGGDNINERDGRMTRRRRVVDEDNVTSTSINSSGGDGDDDDVIDNDDEDGLLLSGPVDS